LAALKAKGVLSDEMPADTKGVNPMWVYALKQDHQGYVIRFKAQGVALVKYQRPGIAPVARMSSFRLLLAIAAELGLDGYGGDINTAYLNARLAIRQYLCSTEGYPCMVNDHVYIVLRALDVLRQSVREWNMEINKWLIDHGFLRSLTETCLIYRFDGETIAYVLVYVDEILVATNNEEFKTKLFQELNDAYGIKDLGRLTSCLGILPRCSVKLRIGIDNQATFVMATNPTYSLCTRHIELRWHFVRDQVEKGAIKLQ
jgi:hypothetical protein